MKIILYTYDIMKIGGIETSFYNLSRYLSDKGHEVSVRYSKADPMRIKRYKDAGIDVGLAKKEICDVLIVGSIWKQPNLITCKVLAQQAHADWSDDFWGGAIQAVGMIKKQEPMTDLYLPVSSSSASFVKEHTNKPVIVMNNLAPEPTKIKKLKNKLPVIAAFTRMTTEKGLNNYEALRDRLKEIGFEAELRVYTTGETPNGWNDREPVEDIRTELEGVDFVASLADTESFGYTIAEANSCGIPCIIKKANSTLEFFDDSSNIILDKVSDLTKDMLTKKYDFKYTLREDTEKNIDGVIATLEQLITRKCIIKSMRTFKDLEAKTTRAYGEVFSVSLERAEELLSNEIKLVERVS